MLPKHEENEFFSSSGISGSARTVLVDPQNRGFSSSFARNSSLWKSLSSTTNNIITMASSLKVNNGGEDYGTDMKNHLMNPLPSLGTALYKSEVFLQVFSEIWWSTCPHDDGKQMYKHQHHDSFSRQQHPMGTKSFLSVEQMKVTRILIKHLHYFSNSSKLRDADKGEDGSFRASFDRSQYSPSSFQNSSILVANPSDNYRPVDPLDDLKHSLWSAKYPVKKRLFDFFVTVFDQWPNDSSFRAPLEAWLSFIQPWRYMVKLKGNGEDAFDNDLDGDLGNNRLLYSDWKVFVTDNLSCYTMLFKKAMARIERMLDNNDSASFVLLHRLTKVFATIGEWIREAEMVTVHPSPKTTRAPGSSFLGQKFLTTSIERVGAFDGKFLFVVD